MIFEKNDQVYAPHIGRGIYVLKNCREAKPENFPSDYPLVIKQYSIPVGANMSSLKDQPTSYIAGDDITQVTRTGQLYQEGGLPCIWMATADSKLLLEKAYGGTFSFPPDSIMFILNGQKMIMREGVSVREAIEKAEQLRKY